MEVGERYCRKKFLAKEYNVQNDPLQDLNSDLYLMSTGKTIGQ